MPKQLDLIRLLHTREQHDRYYRRYREALLEYHRRRYRQWGKTKRFAKAAGISITEARRYIGFKMQRWFYERGILVKVFPRKSSSAQAAHRPRPHDRDDRYAR